MDEARSAGRWYGPTPLYLAKNPSWCTGLPGPGSSVARVKLELLGAW